MCVCVQDTIARQPRLIFIASHPNLNRLLKAEVHSSFYTTTVSVLEQHPRSHHKGATDSDSKTSGGKEGFELVTDCI